MNLMAELIAHAAQLVVEEGLDYGQAKRRAAEQVGPGQRLAWPNNDVLEEAVFEYLRVFCAETQPTELKALRRMALKWMLRLTAFDPHVCGAVWRGTATRLNPIYLQLYCDDPKTAQWQLLDMGVPFEVMTPATHPGLYETDIFQTWDWCEDLSQELSLVFSVSDKDAIRGALKPDGRGRTRMGGVKALQTLLESDHE